MFASEGDRGRKFKTAAPWGGRARKGRKGTRRMEREREE